MKKIQWRTAGIVLCCFFLVCCEKQVDEPNIPSTYNGRSVTDQGIIYVSGRNITVRAWDNGNIDGDIITLVVNDIEVLSHYTLDGFNNKKEISINLENNGYNYILLYIDDEGSELSNTAALSIDDGTGEQDLVLTSDMASCGAMSIYVQ